MNYYLTKFTSLLASKMPCELCAGKSTLAVIVEEDGDDSITKNLCVGCINMLSKAVEGSIDSLIASMKERKIEIDEK